MHGERRRRGGGRRKAMKVKVENEKKNDRKSCDRKKKMDGLNVLSFPGFNSGHY
jgi:ACT domain-containing protein